MDWPAAGVLITAILAFAAPLTALASRKRKMDEPLQLSQQIQLKLDQKLDRIQEDVNRLEVDVGNLQGDSKRTANDLTGMRNEIGELRRELTGLREWLVQHVFTGPKNHE